VKIRLSGIIGESIVDGPGIRFVIFTQGCPHKCKGCHNPETHDFSGGYEVEINILKSAIKSNSLLQGVTFSGGEPFAQAEPLADIASFVHEIKLNIVTYTGYTLEYLIKNSKENTNWNNLLEKTDILIDGPFILEQKNNFLKFRGSKNQRILNCKESLKQGQAVILNL